MSNASGRFLFWLVLDHAPNRLPLMHQVERIIDAFERHLVGNQVVDIDPPVHVPVDDLRHVAAALRAAERGAFPRASGDTSMIHAGR